LGANGGGFPIMLLLCGFHVEQAVCVEMNPLTALRLFINLEANLNGRAIGINAAVCGANSEKEILLQRSRGSTGLSMETNRGSQADPHVSVPAITIRELYDRYFPDAWIDICKIDIEGAEYDALEATPDSVLRRIRTLIIEFHHPARTPPVLSRLRNAGFTEIIPDAESRTAEETEVRSFRNREPV
jgi:FkbM family methyltransferase